MAGCPRKVDGWLSNICLYLDAYCVGRGSTLLPFVLYSWLAPPRLQPCTLTKKMKSALAPVIALGLAANAFAQLQINTPWVHGCYLPPRPFFFHSYLPSHSSNAATCEPLLITWSPGTGTSSKYQNSMLRMLNLISFTYPRPLQCGMSWYLFLTLQQISNSIIFLLRGVSPSLHTFYKILMLILALSPAINQPLRLL